MHRDAQRLQSNDGMRSCFDTYTGLEYTAQQQTNYSGRTGTMRLRVPFAFASAARASSLCLARPFALPETCSIASRRRSISFLTCASRFFSKKTGYVGLTTPGVARGGSERRRWVIKRGRGDRGRRTWRLTLASTGSTARRELREKGRVLLPGEDSSLILGSSHITS